jgi:hypothetical protein
MLDYMAERYAVELLPFSVQNLYTALAYIQPTLVGDIDGLGIRLDADGLPARAARKLEKPAVTAAYVQQLRAGRRARQVPSFTID